MQGDERRNGFEVVEDGSFRKSVERLGISAQLLDDIFEEKAFILGRNPFVYPQIPGRNLYRVKIHRTPRWEAMRAWFEIHGNKVVLIELEQDWEDCF